MKNANKPEIYFRLYSSCIPVEGHETGQLFDLQRKSAFEIPNLLVDVLKNTYDYSIVDLKAHYYNQYDQGIDAYFEKLEEMELGFTTDEPAAFPPLKMHWETPLPIQTAILEIENLSNYDISNVLKQLNDLGCQNIQIRSFCKLELSELDQLLKVTQTSRIKSIELYTCENGYSAQEMDDFIKSHKRISLWVNHSSYEDKLLEYEVGALQNKIYRCRQVIERGQKDYVDVKNFFLDIGLFSEAHQHNVALNRKVSIDYLGNIKNYPSHSQIFGNVQNNALREVTQKAEFQKKWYISNDQIEKCKDCVYRYLCFFNSDLEQRKGRWYKTEDCGYNPYGQESIEEVESATAQV